MLSMIGLVGGLLLLIVLTIRGMNLFIAAPLCALVVALTNNIAVFTGDVNFVETYMSGFSGFIASWFSCSYLVRCSVSLWKIRGCRRSISMDCH